MISNISGTGKRLQ